ncbi:MAG TPA: shikimate kinase [Tepidisphaeraceae bacterium]|nr:shikimate kinase [Tepidisphaeraceae bacterium]
MSVILLGYRGSGKTTIGKKLADRLWLKFVDTDEMITKEAGKTIREIFEADGEPRFRDLETAAVRKACALVDHVIALGGGAVLREENRQIIKDSKLKRIYLRCDPQILFQRIASDPQTAANRPSLTHLGGSIEEIRKLLAEREPLYREVMTSELDVTNLAPAEALVHITRLL